jgi:hypothetical protein
MDYYGVTDGESLRAILDAARGPLLSQAKRVVIHIVPGEYRDTSTEPLRLAPNVTICGGCSNHTFQ